MKNAVFSSEVCIKSVYYGSNEYLYPDVNGFSYDRDRRRVFTSRPGNKVDQGQWKFEPEGDNIYIKSTYFNEYLYSAVNGLSYDGDRRRVFTWRLENKDSQFQWKFEPEGDNIYIKSTYFNEYLYPAVNDFSYDRDRRRVFTWRPGDKSSQCQWKIEDCGSTRKKRDLSHDNASDNSSQSDEIGYNKIGATSEASKPSSWINVAAHAVADTVMGVSQFISSPFKPAIDMEHSQSSKAVTTQGVDANGTLLLLDVFIRKITGQKYVSSNTRSISEQEALVYALSIIEKFEKV